MTAEWHDWPGAATPPVFLTQTDRVYLRWRDGTESKTVRIVGQLRWAHENLPDDIMAYRFSHHAT
jgi:hypothetical protein